MELLDPDKCSTLFNRSNPIHTKVWDNVPTHYSKDCNVKNSLIADGCMIMGSVENSILFRGVHVAEGACVKNSILMQGSVVNRNAKLSFVITDKSVTVTPNKTLYGDASYPIYLDKNITV
jgi:glucose-1-phosphate adenylyltransferase